MPKNTLNTTICNTSPPAIDFTILSGNTCRIISCVVCASTLGSSCATASACFIPTPALLILIAAKPIKSAMVVTISKYNKDFQPIRPTWRMSECPAMPYTNVANKSGAMITLIIFRKILLKICRFWPKTGKSCPIDTPISKDTNIQKVRVFLIKP
ncbi:hypothetical protein D9M68_750290 [compost metagenome]